MQPGVVSVVFQFFCDGRHLSFFGHPEAVVQHVAEQLRAVQFLAVHVYRAVGVIDHPLALSLTGEVTPM